MEDTHHHHHHLLVPLTLLHRRLTFTAGLAITALDITVPVPIDAAVGAAAVGDLVASTVLLPSTVAPLISAL